MKAQTHKEFKREWLEINKTIDSFHAHLNTRLKELAIQYPTAILWKDQITTHTAQWLLNISFETYNDISIVERLMYLKAIEKHRDGVSKYVQGKLFK